MMLSIGHKNFVEINSIVEIMRSDSDPAKKLRRGAAEDQMLINATNGKKVRSLIVLKSNHMVLSTLSPVTLKSRIMDLMPQGLRQESLH